MKVVINSCYGGFQLSEAAAVELGLPVYTGWDGSRSAEGSRALIRNDPRLVEVVERLGRAADTQVSHIEVCDVPDGKHWRIEEYDGYESITCSDSPIEDIYGERVCDCCEGGEL